MADEQEKPVQCPFCKEQINPEATKCSYCGGSVQPARPEHGGLCPYCKESINPEAVTCKHCRSNLQTSSSASSTFALRNFSALAMREFADTLYQPGVGDRQRALRFTMCRNTRPGWAIENTLCGECAEFQIRCIPRLGCFLEQVSGWQNECWDLSVAG